MIRAALLCIGILSALFIGASTFVSAQTQESGSIGLEGRISSAPPAQGATIAIPRDGAVITQIPTTVSGLCTNGLLVKIFKNNVFAGSQQCNNGSYSIQIDLFSGRNELVARVYDDLDQAGPDSNTVIVTFPTGVNGSFPNRIFLTSPFAKRGSNPGQELTWPIILSGGTGPYAMSIDWGDGKTADIISQAFAGTFNIKHKYDSPGVYNLIIRATDKDGNIAFLQLVAVSNGTAGQNNAGNQQDNNGQSGNMIIQTKILWQPAAIAIPLMITSFWLGRKYELARLRKRLQQREVIM